MMSSTRSAGAEEQPTPGITGSYGNDAISIVQKRLGKLRSSGCERGCALSLHQTGAPPCDAYLHRPTPAPTDWRDHRPVCARPYGLPRARPWARLPRRSRRSPPIGRTPRKLSSGHWRPTRCWSPATHSRASAGSCWPGTEMVAAARDALMAARFGLSERAEASVDERDPDRCPGPCRRGPLAAPPPTGSRCVSEPTRRRCFW